MEVGGWRGRMKILLEINLEKSRKSNSCQNKKFKELLSNYIEKSCSAQIVCWYVSFEFPELDTKE